LAAGGSGSPSGLAAGLARAFAAGSFTLALALFAWRKARRGDWRPVFLLGWFVAMILPVLRWRTIHEYYVTVAVIGPAMLAAGLSARARSRCTICGRATALYCLSGSIAR